MDESRDAVAQKARRCMPDRRRNERLSSEEWAKLRAAAKPAGVLSLMYWFKHDALINQALHDDERTTLALFGIDIASAQGKLIVEIGRTHGDPLVARPLLVRLFVQHLADEFMFDPDGDPW